MIGIANRSDAQVSDFASARVLHSLENEAGGDCVRWNYFKAAERGETHEIETTKHSETTLEMKGFQVSESEGRRVTSNPGAYISESPAEMHELKERTAPKNTIEAVPYANPLRHILNRSRLDVNTERLQSWHDGRIPKLEF